MGALEDREKVVKGLECLAKQHGIVGVCEPENCPYGDLHTCANEIARDALALLKAQEPVEPIMRRVVFEHDAFSEAENKMYCPKCKMKLLTRVNYCPWCGQAVKWG